MNTRHAAAIAAFLILASGPAWAATTTGRITYLSSDAKHLMLDNSDLYTIGSGVPAPMVAERVTVTYQAHGADKVISNITPAPAASS